MRFNKLISVFLLSTLVFASAQTFKPRPAQAAIIGGIATATGSPAGMYLLFPALAFTMGGIMTAPGCDIFANCHSHNSEKYLSAALFAGAIILDSNEQAVTFAPISPMMAKQIKLSVANTQLINENLEELNAISSAVSGEVAALDQPTLELAKRSWDQNLSALEPELREAVQALIVNFSR